MDSSSIESYRERIVAGPILSSMVRLGLPLMLTDIVFLIYNLTDAFWLSKFGPYALAVPRQNWPVFLTFFSILFGVSAAGLAMLSQYVGAKMYDKVNESFSKLLTLCLLISFVLFLIYRFSKDFIFMYMVRAPSEILEDVLGYAEIISFDLIATGLGIAVNTLMQSLGDTKTPATIGAIGALINAVLDPLFILGYGLIPAMGARGAALATVLTRLLSAFIVLYLLYTRYRYIRFRLTKHLDIEWLRTVFKVSLPVSIMTISDGFAFTFHLSLVNLFGAVVATAFTIGFMVLDIANSIFRGFTMSISIMVGQNLGAGNKDRARKIALTASHILLLFIYCGAAIILSIRSYIISIFTSDYLVMQEAYRLISIIAWVLPLLMLSFLGMSVGRGSGHTIFPTIVNVIRFWVIRIGIGYILAFVLNIGVLGLWIALAMAEAFGGTASYLWIRWGGWVKPIIKTKPIAETTLESTSKVIPKLDSKNV
jgi:putative MATE family efflux protein